ncbi:MAG: hypothetical protein V2J24_22235 [Pseudomonadales bacterium]|jgi:hypothetical protein|nr:hypothetical protein [Pseudomonadales bacterium]
MTVRSETPALSPRRRAALRLDLEDRQATLITELYSLSLRHCPEARQRVREFADWRLDLAAPSTEWDGDDAAGPPLVAVHGRLERLYAVNRALARLDADDYGCCVRCGERIEFEVLRGDPARTICSDCLL